MDVDRCIGTGSADVKHPDHPSMMHAQQQSSSSLIKHRLHPVCIHACSMQALAAAAAAHPVLGRNEVCRLGLGRHGFAHSANLISLRPTRASQACLAIVVDDACACAKVQFRLRIPKHRLASPCRCDFSSSSRAVRDVVSCLRRRPSTTLMTIAQVHIDRLPALGAGGFISFSSTTSTGNYCRCARTAVNVAVAAATCSELLVLE